MSDYKICSNRGDGRVMRRVNSDGCAVCNPNAENPAEDACICPPLGEPKHLPIIAPVIFDECGINLCRTISIPEYIKCKYPHTEKIELKVIDIDFNFCDEGSEVEFLRRRPNCVRVKLARICVKFAAKFLDVHCRLLGVECFEVEYLPDVCSCSYDEDTNPSSVTVELYAPYGVSYDVKCCEDECGEICECVPIINFLGYVNNKKGNNVITQGIDCQCLATVVDLDFEGGCFAAGISIYLKTVYFIQYKVKHAGLCVPPKCIPIEECGDACKEFVEGDLLEQSIQPLEVCTKPKTISPCGSEPVEDPTPAQAEMGEEKPRRGFFA